MRQMTTGDIEALKSIDTPTVSNAIEGFNVRSDIEGATGPEIRCITPELGIMVGYAVTATADTTSPSTTKERAFQDLLQAIMDSPKPVIVVLKSEGLMPARTCIIGEVISRTMQKMGAVGVVTDGCVRDVQPLRSIGFHAFALGTIASHGIPSLRKVNVPIDIGGMVVEPGDLIHGDENGVVKVPAKCHGEIVEKARQILAEEKAIFDSVESPDFPDSIKHVFGVEQWR
ncbi:MAG: hypothetical protein HYX78_07210 [Armatimonadetes bacterium]|nr:hypothetical protein [Armatimonadota bacterium]